jgi:hypothetical protein
VFIVGLSNHVFQVVQYNDALTSLHLLRSDGKEVHCVEHPIIPTSITLLFPFFICFDTLEEAMLWVDENP